MALNQDANNVTVPSFGPATKLVAITPADGTSLVSSKIKAIWVGGAGNVSIIALGDTVAVTITAVPAGTILPIMPKEVRAATTATLLIGLI